jgi:hypothetical protein
MKRYDPEYDDEPSSLKFDEPVYQLHWVFRSEDEHEDYALDRKDFDSILELYLKAHDNFTVELETREYSEYSSNFAFNE